MDKTGFLTEQVQVLRAGGLYNTIRHIEGPQGSWLQVDGKRVLNFCSNNYLGLANHPRLVAAAKIRARSLRDRSRGGANHRRHDDPP